MQNVVEVREDDWKMRFAWHPGGIVPGRYQDAGTSGSLSDSVRHVGHGILYLETAFFCLEFIGWNGGRCQPSDVLRVQQGEHWQRRWISLLCDRDFSGVSGKPDSADHFSDDVCSGGIGIIDSKTLRQKVSDAFIPFVLAADVLLLCR